MLNFRDFVRGWFAASGGVSKPILFIGDHRRDRLETRAAKRKSGAKAALPCPRLIEGYCLVMVNFTVRPDCLSSYAAFMVFPSGCTVALKTPITLPSRLSVSSRVFLPTIFTETLVMPGSPFIGASLPSSLAVYVWPVGLVMVISFPLTL